MLHETDHSLETDYSLVRFETDFFTQQTPRNAKNLQISHFSFVPYRPRSAEVDGTWLIKQTSYSFDLKHCQIVPQKRGLYSHEDWI